MKENIVRKEMDVRMIKQIGNFLWIFLIIFCFSVSLINPGFAKDEDLVFDKDANYDIYYQVGTSEVDVIRNAKITKKVTEGNLTFLVVEPASFGLKGIKGKEGYILLERVSAVLPSGHINPDRTFERGIATQQSGN